MAEEGLRQKAISGTKWRAIATYSTQMVQLVGSVALAWLVEPRDYGIVAAAMVIIAVIRACGGLGMNYALVQRVDRVEEATHTAFVLLLGVGVVSYGILLAVAPFSRAYGDDPWLMRSMGLLFFLRPVAAVTEGTLQRDFHFRSLFLIEFLSVLLSTALAIGLALALSAGHRYWALAASGLARETARSLAAWYFAKIRPRFAFDRALAMELLHYGKYFLGGAIVMMAYNNIERLALSEMLVPAALGLYVFAYNWVYRVGDVSETVFGGVALSVYAKVQSDVPSLRASFCRIVAYSSLVSTGLLVGMVSLVPEAVTLAFPARWLPSVPIFQVLGFFYMVRAVDTASCDLYAAVGKPKFNMYLGIINLAVMAATVVPFICWWGALGAARCVLVARAVALVCNALVCRRVLQCSMGRLLRIVAPSVKAAAAMALVLHAALLAVLRYGRGVHWPELIGLVVLGGATYVASVYVTDRPLFQDVLSLLRDAIGGRRVKVNGLVS
jgi:PST family polysaccharide transporter